MRIVLNTSILRSRQTGIGTYVAELAAALQRQRTPELTFFDGHTVRTTLNNSPATRSRLPAWLRNIPGAYAARRRLEQRQFDRAVKTLRPTLYHDPSLWPLQFDGPVVMTVHDLAHIDFAWTQPRMRVRAIERELPRALERVARVLVDSHFIAAELQKHYNVPQKKIVVASLAAAADYAPRRQAQVVGTLAKLNLSYRSYFLFVGTLEPRKNLLSALQAHAQLPHAIRQRFPLVIVGGEGWCARDTERALASAIAAGHTYKLGYLARDELIDVLSGAKLFVFPSLYEGFGLPVLEAMACGVPVISSNAPSLSEVGGDAARYVDPNDPQVLAGLMAELVEDDAQCKRLHLAGIERAKLFSWDKCAAITASTYRAAING